MELPPCRVLPAPIAWAAGVCGLLLLAPLLLDAATDSSPLRWTGLALVACAGGVALVVPNLAVRGRWWVTGVALLVLAGFALVATAELGDAWHNAWLVLVIAVGGLCRLGGVSPGTALAGVLGVTAVAGLAGALAGVDAVWALALTVFLSGGSTVVLVLLLSTIEELRSTREQLALAAVARERDRMSRDLHDLLGHTLSLVVVKAEAVRRLAEVDPEAAVTHARDLEEVGRRALLEVRESVHDRRRSSLVSELARVRGTLEATGLDATVSGAPPLLPAEVDEALAWVVREGVTNVVRHAVEARHVDVRVSAGPAGARVEVRDDGRSTGPAGSDGSGLDGLRRRIAEVGGRVEVTAGAPGFRLCAVVPVAGAEQST